MRSVQGTTGWLQRNREARPLNRAFTSVVEYKGMHVQHVTAPQAMIPPSVKSAAKRGPLLALGWFMVGLGVVGAFLPIMPTTVFMLIALWAFSKSSPRFRTWLYTHPRFGPPLQAWERDGAISPRVKVAAILTMAVSFAVAAALASGWIVPAIVGAVLAAVAAFLVTRPSS